MSCRCHKTALSPGKYSFLNSNNDRHCERKMTANQELFIKFYVPLGAISFHKDLQMVQYASMQKQHKASFTILNMQINYRRTNRWKPVRAGIPLLITRCFLLSSFLPSFVIFSGTTILTKQDLEDVTHGL